MQPQYKCNRITKSKAELLHCVLHLNDKIKPGAVITAAFSRNPELKAGAWYRGCPE